MGRACRSSRDQCAWQSWPSRSCLCCGPAVRPGRGAPGSPLPWTQHRQWQSTGLQEALPRGRHGLSQDRHPTLGPRGSRARLRLCSHKRTRCQGASATGGPAPGPSETPNADAGRSGPPWAGLALRFLLSWAGVDEGATCRGCSGRLEGEEGGSQPPAALSPGVFLAQDSRHRGCGREAQRQAILSLP